MGAETNGPGLRHEDAGPAWVAQRRGVPDFGDFMLLTSLVQRVFIEHIEHARLYVMHWEKERF